MSAIELFTPDFEKITTIEKEHLEAYLYLKNLGYRKFNSEAIYIVFKKSLEPIIESIERGQIKLINNFDLAKKISENLAENEIFAFCASKTLLRGCQTREGVVLALKNMAAKLLKDKRVICLPPGCYGERFLFAICSL